MPQTKNTQQTLRQGSSAKSKKVCLVLCAYLNRFGKQSSGCYIVMMQELNLDRVFELLYDKVPVHDQATKREQLCQKYGRSYFMHFDRQINRCIGAETKGEESPKARSVTDSESMNETSSVCNLQVPACNNCAAVEQNDCDCERQRSGIILAVMSDLCAFPFIQGVCACDKDKAVLSHSTATQQSVMVVKDDNHRCVVLRQFVFTMNKTKFEEVLRSKEIAAIDKLNGKAFSSQPRTAQQKAFWEKMRPECAREYQKYRQRQRTRKSRAKKRKEAESHTSDAELFALAMSESEIKKNRSRAMLALVKQYTEGDMSSRAIELAGGQQRTLDQVLSTNRMLRGDYSGILRGSSKISMMSTARPRECVLGEGISSTWSKVSGILPHTI